VNSWWHPVGETNDRQHIDEEIRPMSRKIAVIQNPPVLLDLAATLERAVASIGQVAREGAELAVFPEAFLPGYPTWIWRLRPGGDMALSGEIHERLRRNAVDIDGGALSPIAEAAAQHGVTVVCGMHEIDKRYSGSTLFNTVVVVGPDGTLLNRHRKLIPTNPERMVWGRGDASGLRVVDTPVGRIGCLICWENYMPLARYALYAQNMDMLVAPTWDCGEGWLATMRHIAREGGCWVVSLATALHSTDIPAEFPERDKLFGNDEWLCDGGAVVFEPFGGPIAGPLNRRQEILYAEIDPQRAARARRSLDVSGHYARPDIFSLAVDRSVMPPVEFSD
jgi:nitrilase